MGSAHLLAQQLSGKAVSVNDRPFSLDVGIRCT
jgi:hypothetical protein